MKTGQIRKGSKIEKTILYVQDRGTRVFIQMRNEEKGRGTDTFLSLQFNKDKNPKICKSLIDLKDALLSEGGVNPIKELQKA